MHKCKDYNDTGGGIYCSAFSRVVPLLETPEQGPVDHIIHNYAEKLKSIHHKQALTAVARVKSGWANQERVPFALTISCENSSIRLCSL